jgi:hypothetical protein
MTRSFWVADLNTKGEVQLKAEYQHDSLQHLELAALLIAEFATYIWRSPEEFELAIPTAPHMTLRWSASAPTAGIAVLRDRGNLTSLSLLASGLDPESDRLTLAAFQTHLVRELHDTGFEPAFDLLDIPERPLVASFHFDIPADPQERAVFALSDRCFAAAYFRYLGLA